MLASLGLGLLVGAGVLVGASLVILGLKKGLELTGLTAKVPEK